MTENENFRSFAYRRTLAALGIAQASLTLLSIAQALANMLHDDAGCLVWTDIGALP